MLIKLNEKIAKITGEPVAIVITISPEYGIATRAFPITVKTNAAETYYDYVKIYVDGEEIISKENVIEFEETFNISESSVVRAEVSYLGQLYVKEQNIKLYYPFFIGGGESISDLINQDNYAGTSIYGRFNVTVNENDKILILFPANSEIGMITMSGYEIPFDVTDEGDYILYTSKNTYKQGTYEIRIR